MVLVTEFFGRGFEVWRNFGIGVLFGWNHFDSINRCDTGIFCIRFWTV